MVNLKKLRTSHPPVCGDRRGRFQAAGDFCDFCGGRQKAEDFGLFATCYPRINSLRLSLCSRCGPVRMLQLLLLASWSLDLVSWFALVMARSWVDPCRAIAKIAGLKCKKHTQSVLPQPQTWGQQLAQDILRRYLCRPSQGNLHRARAQSNLHMACRKACRKALAQGTCDAQLGQNALRREQLA